MSACSYCRRPIVWAQRPDGGKPISLQPTPDRSGKYVVVRGEALLDAQLLSRGEPWCDFVDGQRYAPHPAFCPNWPGKRPERPKSTVFVPDNACESCGVIDSTVRIGDTGARCSGCRGRALQDAQGVLV